MRYLAAAAALALAPVAAQAEPVANNTAFGDWIVNCRATTSETTECSLVQTMTRTADQSLVVRFVALPRAGGDALILAQVPIGVHLPVQPALRRAETPEAEQLRFAWQRCLGEVCEAALIMPADELASLTEAGAFLFGYKMRPDEDPIVVKVGAASLAEGLDAIRPKPSE